MSRVLIVASSRKTRGGITAVIKQHEMGEQWKKYHCIWIQTHRDGPSWRKIWYFVTSLIEYCILLPFCDIVHIHHSLVGSTHRKYYYFRLAKLLNKKTILHIHCGNQLLDIWNDDYQDMYSRCDRGIALSHNIKSIIERHIGKSDKIQVVFNPCPLINHPLDTSLRKKEILFSGTLYEGKGYRDLIRSFGKIAKLHPDWKLVFAGNGEVELGKNIAAQCGILDQCNFLGWVSGEAKNKAYRSASILCLPSYAEGFPMAVLDAWAYGLPVITTPVGGIPDIAEDGVNMLLFNPGDVDNLSLQLERMITDDALREAIAKESVHLATTTFNLNTINNQLGRIYEDILTQKCK